MTCKGCLHYKACKTSVGTTRYYGRETAAGNVEELCSAFDEAARFIELPCKIGETVYCISTSCGGCPCFNEPMREEFIETCRKCTLAEIVEMSFDYDMIPEVGEMVFFDRAAAEKALEAWNGKV